MGDDADRTTVRVLDDVDEFLGTDGQEYDLQAGDEVALPAENAAALVDRDAAEPVVSLHGPPEPIVDEDETGEETVRLLQPRDDGRDITAVDLGTWECQRCGAETSTPVRNGETEPPHECPSCERQGPFEHHGLEETDLAPSALADPAWYAPSGISDENYGDLWADVRAWLYENWVADDEYLYDGLTAFAIATWLRPNLNFLPQLMVMGKHETGKTRLLTTIARVAYRGRVPVSFTPAAVYRTVDTYDITLFLSEYHDLNPDLRDEVNAVIKGSQKRGEDVMRVARRPNGEFEPVDFDIFTHVAVGTQFDPPDDIVSRCIQIQTTPADRDVPVWFDEDQATALRNRLLYARYRLLDSEEWREAEQAALEWLNDRGVSGRLREKLLSLVTVADLWDEREAIAAFVEAMEEEAEAAAEESDDALFIRAVRDLAFDEVGDKQVLGDADPWDGLAIPLSDVCERFNDMTGRDVGPSYIGQIRGRLGLEKVRRSDGVVIADDDLREKLQQLCEQNNLDWEHSGYHDPVEELDDREKGAFHCSECGYEEFLTHRDIEGGGLLCEDCADDLRAADG